MRRHRLAALLVAPAITLAACGGTTTVEDAAPSGADAPVEASGGDEVSAQAVLAAASSRAESVGSARVEMTMSFEAAGQSGTMVVTGEQDLRTGQSRMVMDLSDIFAQAGQPMPEGFDPNMEILLDGTMMYMRGGAFEMMGADGWIFLDIEATSELSGVDVSSLTGTQPQDFAAYLDMLRGASEDIVEVGSEEVRGVSTTHFRATVDQSAMYAEMDAEDRASLEALIAQSGFPSTYPMDVWVDADGLVRRISFDLSGLDGEMTSMSMQMEFFDFGVEVDVTPPADAVDLMELMQGFQG